jgi:hypothetical protein
MRIMILRMISTNSLSAFSASITQSRAGQPRPVQGVRALGADPQPAPSQQPPRPAAGTPPAPGSNTLPRGSLLDLSV